MSDPIEMNGTGLSNERSIQFHRKRWLFIGLFLVVAMGVGGYAYWHNHHYNHYAVHERGRVYRSAWMEADAIREVVQAHGIKTVLNLCRPGEMGPTRADDERRAAEAAGARLVELPFPNTTDPHDEGVQPIKALLQQPDTYPILIHCQHGVNRTARVLAMYEVLQHKADGEAAIHKMPRFGRRDYTPEEYEFARNFTNLYLGAGRHLQANGKPELGATRK